MKYLPSILTAIGVCVATVFAVYFTNKPDSLWGFLGLWFAWRMYPEDGGRENVVSRENDDEDEEDEDEDEDDDEICLKYVEDPRTGLCFALWETDCCKVPMVVLVPKDQIPPELLTAVKT